MWSLEGQLLVAPRNRTDPDVAHTVILVVRHNGQEAFGVIMNRPVDQRVLVFGGEESEPLTVPQRQIYIGGPLMGPLMAVHTDESLAEAEILPRLFITTREANVFALLQQSEHRYKVFAGHVGWRPEELEKELEETVWRTTPATADYVLSPSDELWEEVSWHIQEAMIQELFHTRHVPKDPLIN
jgi:putative transcriptional regulator